MLFHFKNLSEFSNIRHFISTRKNGVSIAPYEGLNLGFGTDDNPENIVQNRKILAEEAQIPLENWCVPQQTHSINVVSVNISDKGKGVFSKDTAIPDTDALITNQKGLALLVQSADCVCSVYYDPIKQVIGACHAGWRGTVGKLPQKVVLEMQKEYGSEPKNILVGIGACVSPKMYEVGQDVVDAVESIFKTKENLLTWNDVTQKYHFHLHEAHKYQLLQVGIQETHLEFLDKCTYEHPELFFSARRDKNKTGRFGAGIMLI
jgi:polyphenol oxidase